MYTVKNEPVLLTLIDTDKKVEGSKIVKIYFDNLAIEIKTDKGNGGY